MEYGNTVSKYIEELNKYLKLQNIFLKFEIITLNGREGQYYGIDVYVGPRYGYYDTWKLDLQSPTVEEDILRIVRKLINKDHLKNQLYANGSRNTDSSR